MVDEYKIDDQLRKSLKNDTYQFPDTFQTKTDKQILTRVQDQFSAKIHIKRTPVYFHKHDFVEILYIYKGHCNQLLQDEFSRISQRKQAGKGCCPFKQL